MRKGWRFTRISLWMFIPFILVISMLASAQSRQVLVIDVKGGIGPATADLVTRGLARAAQEQMSLAILTLDTPGGLDKSMRSIVKAILSSPVPVVTFVSPSGSRAASAGTFMLYASHVAAMAPGTNLGAASPVSVGAGFNPSDKKDETNKKDKADKNEPAKQDNQSTMTKKVTNDAVAYIRSLAQLHGRDAKFGEDAVRNAATLTAEDAKKQGVIEIVASDLNDLLTKLDGRTVTVKGQKITLDTKNVTVAQHNPDWRNRFLSVITDPSVAYILLLIGVYGLFFEFANPGFVVPGVCGAISLLIALYAFQLLPINYAGLGLIGLGIIFMVAEAFMPSFGALGFGGVIAFIVGSILLFDANLAGYYLAWPLIFSMAAINAGFFMLVIGMAIKARRREIVSGREAMLGAIGEVVNDCELDGQARVNGEIWHIRTEVSLKAGDKVKVIALNGLILEVEPHH